MGGIWADGMMESVENATHPKSPAKLGFVSGPICFPRSATPRADGLALSALADYFPADQRAVCDKKKIAETGNIHG